jgi:hypothetical protein
MNAFCIYQKYPLALPWKVLRTLESRENALHRACALFMEDMITGRSSIS